MCTVHVSSPAASRRGTAYCASPLAEGWEEYAGGCWGGDKFFGMTRSWLSGYPRSHPDHGTSPDLIRGLLHRSTRVEGSVGPGSSAGGVSNTELGLTPPPSILPHKGGGDGAWEAVIVRTESTAPLATPTPVPSPQGGGRRAGAGAGLHNLNVWLGGCLSAWPPLANVGRCYLRNGFGSNLQSRQLQF